MFDFTNSARKILEETTHTEAKRLNSNSIESEHIFLALLDEDDSISIRILKYLGVNIDNLKREIEESVRRVGTAIILGKLPVSSGFRRIVDLARDEASSLKNSYIGTEHLLLSLFRDGTSAGISTLGKNGINYSTIRRELLRFLGVRNVSDKTAAGQRSKSSGKTSALEEFARDLTEIASKGLLDPVIGRSSEISRVIRILSRKRKNNPILIGEAGVGKTAVVEGLSQRIVDKQVPDPLQDKRVFSLDMASVVAGTKYRGEFEERLKRLVSEVGERKNVILFIDEIHTIIGAGAAEGAIDAANILKPALARGELHCIGATTIGEYHKHVEKDSALARRFQSVMVNEPDHEQTVAILRGLKEGYEKHHKVHFSDEALEEAVAMSARYINDGFLPDKAIDLIDEAGAKASLDNCGKPKDIEDIENEIAAINMRKNELVRMQEYEQAAALRDLLIEKRNALESKIKDWTDRRNDYTINVDSSWISQVISENTGIPAEKLEEKESERLLHMEEALSRRIIGQEEAISALAKALRRSRIGLSDDKRPLGSFIFLGPTGVGKTELAKVLAEFLFDDAKNLIRFDMSEYMEKHSVARFIGSPPGYIGYEEGGQLSEKVKRRPYSVLLFDEIEKAHPDVVNILLQILDDGVLTDGSGFAVSFKDTIIIMTSNAGTREYQKMSRLGFADDTLSQDKNERTEAELKRLFPPEFLNRIDEILYFNKLSKREAFSIIDIMLEDIRASVIKKRKIDIEFSSGLKKFIADKGFSELYGARNLRKVIRREIEDALAAELLKGGYEGCRRLSAFCRAGKVGFKPLDAEKPENADLAKSALSSKSV